MDDEEMNSTDLALFESQTIRKVWHQDRWFFSVIDVVTALTESERARKYWSDLKSKLFAEGYVEVSARIGHLKMLSPDGKMRATDAADTETLLRIIQSIPSPKADPFKRWLAQVGTERIQEIQNPEVAIERMRDDYRRLGRPEDWIEKRIQSILVRNELTHEWDERGAQKKDYGVLTNIIAKETFDIEPQVHKEIKGLQKENLRDHMTPMELVLTMLGEVTTTELHRERDSQGVPKLRRDAKDGGAVAGRAREDIEQQLGAKVVSPDNYLPASKEPEVLQAPLIEDQAETEE
jgi:DNA-damage-inducible protein D